MNPLIFLLAFVVSQVVGDGVQFSRTVTHIAPDTNFVLEFDAGCSSKDAYGSNNCAFKWGQKVTGSYEGVLGHDLEAGSTLVVNMKVDKKINFLINCAACRANCSFTIPVINKPMTIPLPDCPIPATTVTTTLFEQVLPDTSPTNGVKVTSVGTIEIYDSTKLNILNLYIDATIQ